MSVLLPESLVRIIADVHGVTFEEVRQWFTYKVGSAGISNP